MPGWTSIVVIISFFFSILFLNIIVSIYLSKNIEESRKAATYFIAERLMTKKIFYNETNYNKEEIKAVSNVLKNSQYSLVGGKKLNI